MSPKREYKGAPLGGIWAIAVIAVLEYCFCRWSEPLTGIPLLEPTADDATVVAKRLLLDRAPRSVILVGDSSCMMDLIPGTIEGATDFPVVNLGVLSTFTLAGVTAMAEEVLRRPDPPKAIVLAVLPQSFEVTEAEAREFDLVGRYLVAYSASSTLYKQRLSDYRSWFYNKHRVNRFPPAFGGSFAAFSEGQKASNGYLEEKRVYKGGEPVRNTFRASPFAINAVRHLAASAGAKKIPLFLWFSPTPDDAATPSYLKAAYEELCEVQRWSPWLRIAQPEAPHWDVKQFGSVTHLTRQGAENNSKSLAAFLLTALR